MSMIRTAKIRPNMAKDMTLVTPNGDVTGPASAKATEGEAGSSA